MRSSLRQSVICLAKDAVFPSDILMMVAPYYRCGRTGSRSHWVRNALANESHFRVYLRGQWRAARLRLIDTDPESYLRRMNKVHAAFVRVESTTPAVVEIVPE
jgi:hypothetical protein